MTVPVGRNNYESFSVGGWMVQFEIFRRMRNLVENFSCFRNLSQLPLLTNRHIKFNVCY